MNSLEYNTLLKDPRWQKLSAHIKERDGWACKLCGSTTDTLVVHHTRYIKSRKPWEYDEQLLITICDSCHNKLHPVAHKPSCTETPNTTLQNISTTTVLQPWGITAIGKAYSLRECHILSELMCQLNNIILEAIRTGRSNIFNNDFANNDTICVRFNIRPLSKRIDCDKFFKASIDNLCKKTGEPYIFENATEEKDSYGRRNGIIDLYISKEKSIELFSIARWCSYSKEVVANATSSYTAHLYMLLSGNIKYGWTIGYKELKHLLGLDHKYNNPKNFKFKVLDTAINEINSLNAPNIRNVSYEFIYELGIRKALNNIPSKIKFTINRKD